MKWVIGFIFFAVVCVMATPSFFSEKVINDQFEVGQAKTLVILLHAIGRDGESLKDVETALAESLPSGADFFRPDLPLSYISNVSANEIVAQLLMRVDEIWAERKAKGASYEKVIIIGHSMGALLARKLYVAAYGENASAPFEQDLKDSLDINRAAPLTFRREWTKKSVRIVLLAGINRGWTVSHHMSWTRATYTQLGIALSYFYEFFYERKPVGMEVRRGAPFITQLRLQWLEMERCTEKDNNFEGGGCVNEKAIEGRQQTGNSEGTLEVVQLLGTVDDLVSPDDNLDLEVGRKFYYDSVPYSGHVNVIQLKSCQGLEAINPDTCDLDGKRKEKIIEAVILPLEQKNEMYLGQDTLDKNKEVSDVVFVIHGIRDEGYWTRKIGNHIKTRYESVKPKGKLKLETSSYGYFSMLSFLIPGERQRKVEWLMDRYVRARALYPNAKFHFVGHSNGTYLLAKALQDYPAVYFENVVFAGSVVHRKFSWEKYSKSENHKKQIEKVLNYVATSDWVVAFFPNALQILGWQDLGSAGHDGFDDAVAKNEKYIVGSHSAALNEKMWDSIAEFVVNGSFLPSQDFVKNKRYWLVEYLAYVAPVILVLIGVLLVYIFIVLLRLRIREWKKTLIIVAYLSFIWNVLTKV